MTAHGWFRIHHHTSSIYKRTEREGQQENKACDWLLAMTNLGCVESNQKARKHCRSRHASSAQLLQASRPPVIRNAYCFTSKEEAGRLMLAYKRNLFTAKVTHFFQRLGPERSFFQALHITTLGLQL